MTGMNEYATVDDIIEMLQKLSARGYGDRVVVCNDEYYLARKGDVPTITHETYNNMTQTREIVNLGGY